MNKYDLLKQQTTRAIREVILNGKELLKEEQTTPEKLIIDVSKTILTSLGFEEVLDIAKTDIKLLKKEKEDNYSSVLGPILNNIVEKLIDDLEPIIKILIDNEQNKMSIIDNEKKDIIYN